MGDIDGYVSELLDRIEPGDLLDRGSGRTWRRRSAPRHGRQIAVRMRHTKRSASMKVEGSFVVDGPIERVGGRSAIPRLSRRAFPDVRGSRLGANSYRTSVRVALGPIATTFNATVEITEEEPP